jgi:hypothetical protein
VQQGPDIDIDIGKVESFKKKQEKPAPTPGNNDPGARPGSQT